MTERSGKGQVVGQSKVYVNFRVSVNEIRDRLRVKEGERVIFVEEGGRIFIKRMEP